jgi:hypothetical protein
VPCVDGKLAHVSDSMASLRGYIEDLLQLPQLEVMRTRSHKQGPFDRLSQEFFKRSVEFSSYIVSNL